MWYLQDANEQVKKKIQQTREARSETRRIQNVLSSRGEDISDLLKFNQLKVKQLTSYWFENNFPKGYPNCLV